MLLAFAIIAPYLIMYSQGYRLDLSQRKFIKTGGIYIKAYPQNVSVSIDGKYKNITSSFTRDLLIQNILPETHEISVKKDGYISWSKKLPVEETKVAEAKFIILFPSEEPFSTIKDNVENFSFYGQNKFLLSTTDQDIISYDIASKQETEIASKLNFADVIFSEDNNTAVIKTKAGLYYLLNLKNAGSTQIKNISKNATDLAYSSNTNSLYYLAKGQIYKLSLGKSAQQPAIFVEGKYRTFSLSGSYLYALDEDGYADLISLSAPSSANHIYETPLDLDSAGSYQIKTIEGDVFIFEKGVGVYHFNKSSNAFEKIISSSQEITFDSYYDRILFTDGNELWLYLVKNVDSPFYKTAGTVIHITRLSQKIENVEWLNSDYFTYSLDGKIWISEIDNRDHINAFSIAGILGSKILFDGNTKKMFVLNGNTLMSSDNKIIP